VGEWERKEIPCRPGLYQLVAVDEHGEPLKDTDGGGSQQCERVSRAFQNRYAGVLYIGKACNLQDRFWKLIQSWKSVNKPPSTCHGSRKTWEELSLKTKYPLDRMRFRYMPISSTNWKKMKQLAKQDGIESLLAEVPTGTRSLGHDRSFAPVEHLAIKEYQMLKGFHRLTGRLPWLNRIHGEHPGGFPDETWWLQHEREQDRMRQELQTLFGEDGSIDPDMTDDVLDSI